MPTVSLHYWAGARAAAGVEFEQIQARSLAEAFQLAREMRNDAHFDRVLSVSSLLANGVAIHARELDLPLTDDLEIEVLPPFAGG